MTCWNLPGAIRRAAAACFTIAILALPAFAQGANPIVLYLGEGTGNRGDTALVSVELGVGNTRPTNMVVWLTYDPAKVLPDDNAFEFTVVDLEGNPIRDENNNVITSRGPVRREQNLIDAGKQIDTESYPEGVLGIAVQGLNDDSIAPGNILTVAFKVQNGVAENEVVDIEGAEESDPAQFNNGTGLVTVWSEAAYKLPGGEPQDLEVEVSDGRILVPCTPPAAPTSVSATQGQPDAVVVTWTAAPTSGATYRVYRAEVNNPASALPLGQAPVSGTTFTDITALAPVVPAGGCACNAEPAVVRYFYWVRTLSPTACESAFSTPAAEGFRGTAKAASAAAKTAFDTLPSVVNAQQQFLAGAGGRIAVRLEDVDAATVWAEATAGTWRSDHVHWVASGDDSGWAAIDLPANLVPGTVVVLTAGAEGAGPVIREFLITGKAEKSASVTDLGVDTVPYLPEGVGNVYQVGPAGLLAAPATVYLPVPAGEDAAQLLVYTYVHAQGDRRWYFGENVSGWLAATPAIATINGQPHVKIVINHGATVQLGTAPAPAAPATQASLAPGPGAGNVLVLALLAATLLGGRAAVRPKHRAY